MMQFPKRKYDLEERTAHFGEKIIDLCKKSETSFINRRIIMQFIGSGGSRGANYCEATPPDIKKDFIHKLSICKKEAKETKHWLRLLARTNPELKDEIKGLQKESRELLLIFSKSINSARNRKRKLYFVY